MRNHDDFDMFYAGSVRRVIGYLHTVTGSRARVPDDLPGLSPDYIAIVAALRQISAVQRQAIVLHHLVDLSVDEISRKAGVSAGTVKARLSRGRRALAVHLADSAPGLGFNGQEVPSNA